MKIALKVNIFIYTSLPSTHRLRKLIINMHLLLKAMYRFNAVSIKIPMLFLLKENPKIHVKTRSPQIAKEILNKKNNVDFNT